MTTISAILTAPTKVIGAVANALGFGSVIGSGTFAAKLMAWTSVGGKVAKGLSYLQHAGAVVANAGVIATIASVVGTAIGTNAIVSSISCSRNATVMSLSRNDYQEMKTEIQSIIESLKEPIMKVYSDLVGSNDNDNDDDNQYESVWNDLSSRISSNVKLMDEENAKSTNEFEEDYKERTDESDL